jgi:hypothetical protein
MYTDKVYSNEDIKKTKKITSILKDEEWRTPEKIADKLDIDTKLVRGVLMWVSGHVDNYHKKYEPIGGDNEGGGSVQVYFMREVPTQRTMADFI